MNRGAPATMVTGGYLLLAAAAIAYELGIRIFNRGNSEFAGMLSGVLTLPSSLLVAVVGKTVLGVSAGDSDVWFVVLLGLSAIVNASILWLTLRPLRRSRPQ